MQIDCYIDSDFDFLWNYEDSADPTSIKRVTDFLFTLGWCPISWTSKLHTEIALSTIEAEYIDISITMKEFLPL